MAERSARRRHDCDRFFKYMTFDTAKIVLTKRTIRWSSPSRFNDIFDVPKELALGFAADEFKAKYIEEFAKLFQVPDSLDVSGNRKLHFMLQQVKRVSAERRRELAGC